jgi:hypothetical protein
MLKHCESRVDIVVDIGIFDARTGAMIRVTGSK